MANNIFKKLPKSQFPPNSLQRVRPGAWDSTSSLRPLYWYLPLQWHLSILLLLSWMKNATEWMQASKMRRPDWAPCRAVNNLSSKTRGKKKKTGKKGGREGSEVPQWSLMTTLNTPNYSEEWKLGLIWQAKLQLHIFGAFEGPKFAFPNWNVT